MFTKSEMYIMVMIGLIGLPLPLNEISKFRYKGRLHLIPLRYIG